MRFLARKFKDFLFDFSKQKSKRNKCNILYFFNLSFIPGLFVIPRHELKTPIWKWAARPEIANDVIIVALRNSPIGNEGNLLSFCFRISAESRGRHPDFILGHKTWTHQSLPDKFASFQIENFRLMSTFSFSGTYSALEGKT